MGKTQREQKERTENRRQDFLLSYFVGDNYQEKEVNGFWLIKNFNGSTQKWQVSIYTKESYKNYKEYGEKVSWQGIKTRTPELFLSSLYKKFGKKR